MSPQIPFLDGVLTADEVARTAATIVGMQEADGAIPWTVGDKVDVWNHVEAAMALLVAGEVEAAERAYEWCLTTQRPDGTWPIKFVEGAIADDGAETNMSAYLAVGVWHHWLVRAEAGFVERMWPAVRSALDWVVSMQLPWGGIAWRRRADGGVDEEALLTGSSSTYHALKAGLALAGLLGEPQPEWEIAAARLRHAIRRHRDLFLDKSTFSMDWYYPVLGGAVRGSEAAELIEAQWDQFVRPGLGIVCVDTNPWVTGAETCELAMALDAVGDRARAEQLVRDMQHLRHENGSYWTGWVYDNEVYWPHEQTTYTAAAVILAVDALGRVTPGSGIMRGETLPADFAPMGLRCGCEPAAERLGQPV